MRRSDPVEVEAERLRLRLLNAGVEVDLETVTSVLRAQRAERRERSMRGKKEAMQNRSAASAALMPASYNPNTEPSPSTDEEGRIVALLGTEMPDSEAARIGSVSPGFVTMVRQRYPQHIAAMIAQSHAARRETGENTS